VVPISVPKGYNSIASRFDDTLTKLRAFEPLSPSVLLELGLEKAPEAICFLDADIMIRKNMDDVFDIPLPGNDWIAAHHACICNIDNDPWAPKEWKKENCAVTPLRHPEALEGIVPNTTAEMERVRLDEEKQQTYRLLNSGVFVCRPTQELWERMEKFRVEDPRVKDFAFPDQNFLDVFFRDRWVSLGWQWNAVKTHRYWHSEVWRDEEIRALHYIVDKPWAKRIGKDGVAGYLGRDGTTHSWWWDEYGDWELRVEKREKGNEVLECVSRYAAKPLGEGLVDIVKPKSQEMEKVEGKVIVEVAPAGKLPT
jgi:alpha-N-acetylglucosamine transferase